MADSPQLSNMGDMIQPVNYEKWKKKWTVSGDVCVNQAKDIVIREDRIDGLIQLAKNEMQVCISCPCTLEPITDPCIDDFGNSYQHSELKKWFDAAEKQISPCNNKLIKNIYPNPIIKALAFVYTAYLESRTSFKTVGEIITCQFTGKLIKDPVILIEDLPTKSGLTKYITYSKRIIPQMLEMFDCNSCRMAVDDSVVWIFDSVPNLAVQGFVENYKKVLLYEFCRTRIKEERAKPSPVLRLTLTMPEKEEVREVVHIPDTSPAKKKRLIKIKHTEKTTKKRKREITYESSDTECVPSDEDNGVVVLDDPQKPVSSSSTDNNCMQYVLKDHYLSDYIHASAKNLIIKMEGIRSHRWEEYEACFTAWYNKKISKPLSKLTNIPERELALIFFGCKGNMNNDIASEATMEQKNSILNHILFKSIYTVYNIPYASHGVYYDLVRKEWIRSDFVAEVKTKTIELGSISTPAYTGCWVYDKGTSLFIHHIRDILSKGILNGAFNNGQLAVPWCFYGNNSMTQPVLTSPWMDQDGNLIPNKQALEYKKRKEKYYVHEERPGETHLMATGFLIHHPLLRQVLGWVEIYNQPKYLINNTWFLKLIESTVRFNCLMKGKKFCQSISEEYYRKVFGIRGNGELCTICKKGLRDFGHFPIPKRCTLCGCESYCVRCARVGTNRSGHKKHYCKVCFEMV